MKRALLLATILAILSCKRETTPPQNATAPTDVVESYNAIAAAAIKDDWHLVYEGYSSKKRRDVDACIGTLISIDSFTNGSSPLSPLSPKERYVSYMLSLPERKIVQSQFGTYKRVDTLENSIELSVKSKKEQLTYTMVQEAATWKIEKVTKK